MFRALTLTAALTLPALATQAAEVTADRLDNGMEVVVIEDHRAPVVVHMVWYRTGAADEVPGKSGIAHFLEHLMFKGTERFPGNTFGDAIAATGGSENAFTSFDYTAYHQRVAAEHLPAMMEMEADRMRGLVLTDAVVDPERSVILEERAQRVDSDPGALFSEQRAAAQYLNHPYGIPVIGWRAEMEDLSREDALAFYDLHYAPQNAILVVAGDVAPDEVLEQARETYGAIPPGEALPARVRPQEPPQLSPRLVTMTDDRVAQPYVTRSYLAPERDPGAQEEAAALLLLSRVLGGSAQTSVLAQTLINAPEAPALMASAWYNGTAVDDTTFGMAVMPKPGVTLEEAEAALDDALAAFLNTGIDPEQFARIKTEAKAAQVYADDDLAGLARRYGAALATGLTVQDVEAWPALIEATTAEQVMEAAHAVLRPERSVTGYLRAPETGPGPNAQLSLPSTSPEVTQ